MAQDKKSQQKQGASNRIMKIIQLDDEQLLPTPCRMKNVVELQEDMLSVAMSVLGEHSDVFRAYR